MSPKVKTILAIIGLACIFNLIAFLLPAVLGFGEWDPTTGRDRIPTGFPLRFYKSRACDNVMMRDERGEVIGISIALGCRHWDFHPLLLVIDLIIWLGVASVIVVLVKHSQRWSYKKLLLAALFLFLLVLVLSFIFLGWPIIVISFVKPFNL